MDQRMALHLMLQLLAKHASEQMTEELGSSITPERRAMLQIRLSHLSEFIAVLSE